MLITPGRSLDLHLPTCSLFTAWTSVGSGGGLPHRCFLLSCTLSQLPYPCFWEMLPNKIRDPSVGLSLCFVLGYYPHTNSLPKQPGDACYNHCTKLESYRYLPRVIKQLNSENQSRIPTSILHEQKFFPLTYTCLKFVKVIAPRGQPLCMHSEHQEGLCSGLNPEHLLRSWGSAMNCALWTVEDSAESDITTILKTLGSIQDSSLRQGFNNPKPGQARQKTIH